MSEMRVRLRFFASVREKLGKSEVTCTVPAGATVAEVLDHLCRENRALEPLRRSLSVAVNREYVDADHALSDNDEVALIPPVSGG
jgi:molybdopterin converting factor subunit 1